LQISFHFNKDEGCDFMYLPKKNKADVFNSFSTKLQTQEVPTILTCAQARQISGPSPPQLDKIALALEKTASVAQRNP
jgi:hypothetical protein